MKKISLLCAIALHFYTMDASKTIFKAMSFLPKQEEKTALTYTTAGQRMALLGNMAMSYINFLRLGSGTELDLLDWDHLEEYDPKRVKKFKESGLTKSDVETIKNLMRQFFFEAPGADIFTAMNILPEWIAHEYEDIRYRVANLEMFNNLGPIDIRAGVAEYIVNEWYKKHPEYKKNYEYIFKKKTVQNAPILKEENIIRRILEGEIEHYAFINDIDYKYPVTTSVTHIIVNAQDIKDNLMNPTTPIQIKLLGILSRYPNLIVVAAFKNTDRAAANVYRIFSEKITQLVITGVSLIETGENFLYGSRSISNLVLPHKLISLGGNFLIYSSSLKQLDIPLSVKHIGESFLFGCVRLQDLKVPSTIMPELIVNLFNPDGYAAYPEERNIILNNLIVVFKDSDTTIPFHFKVPNSNTRVFKNWVRNLFIEGTNLIHASARFLAGNDMIETLQLPTTLITADSDFLTGCHNLRKITMNRRLFINLGGSSFFNQQKFPSLSLENIHFYPDDISENIHFYPDDIFQARSAAELVSHRYTKSELESFLSDSKK